MAERIRLVYTGTFRVKKLLEEVVGAFPGWVVDGTALFSLSGEVDEEGIAGEVVLNIPEDGDVEALGLVINAHDPMVLSAGEVAEAERAAAAASLLEKMKTCMVVTVEEEVVLKELLNLIENGAGVEATSLK